MKTRLTAFIILFFALTSYAHSPYGRQGEPKSRYKTSTAPTVNDDIGDGYVPGSLWVDTVGDKVYVCVDNTIGASVWTEQTIDDHGNLAGLADDDHAQYILTDGTRAYTGTGNGFKDEDNMASDSATAAASQQSIKAYADALVAGVDTQVQFNDGGAFGGDAGLVYNKTSNQLSINSGGLEIISDGTASDLLQIKNASSVEMFTVEDDGKLHILLDGTAVSGRTAVALLAEGTVEDSGGPRGVHFQTTSAPNTAAGATTHACLVAEVQTAAGSQDPATYNVTGLQGSIFHNSARTPDIVTGLAGSVELESGSGQASEVFGLRGQIQFDQGNALEATALIGKLIPKDATSTSSLTDVACITGQIRAAVAGFDLNATNGYIFRWNDDINGADLNFTNFYGLYIPDTSGIGGTISRAIHTGGGDVVFNDDGTDSDFRVEGDTDTNLIRTDAANDKVGISENEPNATLDVNGDARFGDSDTNYVEVESDGDIVFVGGGGLQFGNCYGNEIGWSQAAAVQNTWYDISDADMTNGGLHGITHDGNGQLTVSKAGWYAADWSGAFEADATNVHIQITFSVNGTETSDGLNHFETFGTSKQQSMSGIAILDLAASDTVNVSIRTTDAGAPDLAIDHLMLRLSQVGGT